MRINVRFTVKIAITLSPKTLTYGDFDREFDFDSHEWCSNYSRFVQPLNSSILAASSFASFGRYPQKAQVQLAEKWWHMRADYQHYCSSSSLYKVSVGSKPPRSPGSCPFRSPLSEQPHSGAPKSKAIFKFAVCCSRRLLTIGESNCDFDFHLHEWG